MPLARGQEYLLSTPAEGNLIRLYRLLMGCQGGRRCGGKDKDIVILWEREAKARQRVIQLSLTEIILFQKVPANLPASLPGQGDGRLGMRLEEEASLPCCPQSATDRPAPMPM